MHTEYYSVFQVTVINFVFLSKRLNDTNIYFDITIVIVMFTCNSDIDYKPGEMGLVSPGGLLV